MLDYEELDMDSTVYEPWDFHDPWDQPPVYWMEHLLLREVQAGGIRASFLLQDRWMLAVSKHTQDLWRQHELENPTTPSPTAAHNDNTETNRVESTPAPSP